MADAEYTVKVATQGDPSGAEMLEFARLFDVTPQHGIHLVEEPSLVGIDCSSGANLFGRRLWRIPLPEVQRFAVGRSNLGAGITTADAQAAKSSRERERATFTLAALASRFATPCNAVCNAPLKGVEVL
jgi:hypothetical protein